ncbi:hypothetical protein [Robinsoniella peoriensis]|uniref:hypothetical protein n=1 Tax=Robinsoniella peoriensis TaxID=180332 RepID=UPI00375392D0
MKFNPPRLLTKESCSNHKIEYFASAFIKHYSFKENFDYSVQSLSQLDHILKTMPPYAKFNPAFRQNTRVLFGCYILETARRSFGGRYKWWEIKELPILLSGEPQNAIGIAPFDKVLERMVSDVTESIPEFFQIYVDMMEKSKTESRLSFIIY